MGLSSHSPIRLAEARALGTHTPSDWYAIVRAMRRRCAYCNRVNDHWSLTKDHRVPVSRGGSDGPENLAVSCRECNKQKRRMTEDEFRDWMEASDWRKQLQDRKPEPSPNGRLALERLRARRRVRVSTADG